MRSAQGPGMRRAERTQRGSFKGSFMGSLSGFFTGLFGVSGSLKKVYFLAFSAFCWQDLKISQVEPQTKPPRAEQ